MSLRVFYLKRDWLRGSEVVLGVELVLGIHALCIFLKWYLQGEVNEV